MITNELDIFITRYYEFTNIEFPNKNSIIKICPKKKCNAEYLKKQFKKQYWLGIVDKNKIILKFIKNIIDNKILYSNLELTYKWDEWKKIVGYSKRYNPNMLVSSKNPFPTILKID